MQKEFTQYLERLAELSELASENPFKVRALQKAARTLAELELGNSQNISNVVSHDRDRSFSQILQTEKIPGIGKGILELFHQFQKGDRSEEIRLQERIPKGLMELMPVSGLGVKKARAIVETLGVQSLAELEYACRENRLVDLPGFGMKTQERILASVLWLQSQKGKARFDQIEDWVKQWKTTDGAKNWVLVGDFAAGREIVECLEFLRATEIVYDETDEPFSHLKTYLDQNPPGVRWQIHPPSEHTTHSPLLIAQRIWELTASPRHQKAFAKKPTWESVPPEAWELDSLPPKKMLEEADLRGVFHVHTLRSDGADSLEALCQACVEQGYSYLGISDHSRSAVYARGLDLSALREQKAEILKMGEKFPKLRIFWGIESDILENGDLDYEEAVLAEFDFVVASIHSRLKQDPETATRRIERALSNPATTFLGHPTGRILLGRAPLDADWSRIMKIAAQRGVILELNAHPARLDVQWEWLPEIAEAGGWISINPDAHECSGLKDVRHGVRMVRKGWFPPERVWNTQSTELIEQWLKEKK